MRWIRKILVILMVTFAVFYLVTRPESAASAVRDVFSFISNAFSAIMTFFTKLAG